MREDMFKVIVERARLRGGWSRERPHQIRDLEDGGPSYEPLRPRSRRTKQLNENLAPLVRFLKKSTGRPWNKIYAEICKRLSVRNTVQQHVRDHLRDFVAIGAKKISGEIWVPQRFGPMCRLEESFFELYVHPVSGLLLKNRARTRLRQEMGRQLKARLAELTKRRRDIAPDVQWHRLRDDVWYEVKLASSVGVKPAPFDVVIGAGLSDLPPFELYGRHDVYARAKRQLGKKELRELRDAS